MAERREKRRQLEELERLAAEEMQRRLDEQRAAQSQPDPTPGRRWFTPEGHMVPSGWRTPPCEGTYVVHPYAAASRLSHDVAFAMRVDERLVVAARDPLVPLAHAFDNIRVLALTDWRRRAEWDVQGPTPEMISFSIRRLAMQDAIECSATYGQRGAGA